MALILKIIRKLIRLTKTAVIDNPLSVKVRVADYEKTFETATDCHLFRGVYNNFQEAIDSAPSTKGIGYDHPEPASFYLDRIEQIFASDYPVLFWLGSLLKPGCKVFDLGGHIGVGFYAYQKYLDYPEGLRWLVCDVEEVIITGKMLAERKRDPRIAFTTNYAEADGHDVLFASGSLQYIEKSLAALLEPLSMKPAHLIINLLPVHDGKPFVTLNNIGAVFCPYHVFNKAELIASMRALGYECVDIWKNEEKRCAIPFYPEHSLDAYHGFYFRAC